MLKKLSFEQKDFIIIDNNDSKTLELKDEQIKAKDHIGLVYLEPLKELKKKCAIAKAINANNELQIKFYSNVIEEEEKLNLANLFNHFLKNHIILNDLDVCNLKSLLSIFYEVNKSIKSQTFYSICGLPILEILAQSYLSRYAETFFNISNIQKEIEAALYYKCHCEMPKEPLKVNIYGMSVTELDLLKRKFLHQWHLEPIKDKEGFYAIIKQDNNSFLELYFTSKKVANLEEEISISGKIPNVNQEACANELKILIPSKNLSRFLLLDKLLDEEKLKIQRNGADWIYLVDRYCKDEITLQNRYVEKHFKNNFSSFNDYLEIKNSLTSYLKANYQKEGEKGAFVLFHSLVFLNEMGWDKFMLEPIWKSKFNDLQNKQIKNASFLIAVENGNLPSFIGFYGVLQAIILVRGFFDKSVSFNVNEGRWYISCEGFFFRI